MLKATRTHRQPARAGRCERCCSPRATARALVSALTRLDPHWNVRTPRTTDYRAQDDSGGSGRLRSEPAS